MSRDEEQINFPMIATSQAPELVRDANQSIGGDLPSIWVDPLTISQPIFTGFSNPQKPRRDLWNEPHKLWTHLWNPWPSQGTTQVVEFIHKSMWTNSTLESQTGYVPLLSGTLFTRPDRFRSLPVIIRAARHLVKSGVCRLVLSLIIPLLSNLTNTYNC